LVNKNVSGQIPVIGRIDLLPGYTLFDVRKDDAHRVLDALKHADFFGDKIYAEVATDRDYSAESKKARRGGKKYSKDKDESAARRSSSRADRKPASQKKESKSKKSRKRDDMDDYIVDFVSSKLNKSKDSKKNKKEKKVKSSKKPKYNGNYDIFMK
ncbi:MAG: DbpA RNA binding domain-containing protein, partial [Muribaculaceae bacterium]|nr:DbpA RNA binding domain-containing protein [Muribaculaceae bacterium]